MYIYNIMREILPLRNAMINFHSLVLNPPTPKLNDLAYLVIHPYIPSHSSSSSCSAILLRSSILSLSCFAKSVRSSGHVPLSLNQGRTHSKSNKCVGWHGNRTTSGYLSSKNGLLQIGHACSGFSEERGTRSSPIRHDCQLHILSSI